ncbi:MAG: long-chain-fatty-acid--CoA ligase [Desulfobacterales bacterium]|jgi:acyl-CoA synthetase (AMP-forming)/AMP-acid ligase II|nr:long-chain-fatty-acid--CoA ligase [Desulfobacterales bacterium]
MWIYPEIKTLADVPAYHAQHRGDETVFLLSDRSITFNELERQSNRVANALVTKGISGHSRIAFLGKNSELYFYVLFGAMKAGHTFTPLNWRLSAVELTVILEDAAPPVLFADVAFKATIEKIQAESAHQFQTVYIDWSTPRPKELEQFLESATDDRPMIEISSEDTAFQIYTSGTTGVPKGVELTFGSVNFWFLLLDLEPTLTYATQDVMLFIAPNFHLLGMHFSISALYNGTKVSILPEVRFDSMLDAIHKHRVSVLVLAPIMIEGLLNAAESSPADFSSLKLVVYAGSAIGLNLLKRALKEMKCDFMQFYGVTEVGGGVTLLRPEEHDLENEEKLKSCGRPLPYVEVKLMAFNGREAGVGQAGEFWVRVPSVFKQYYNKPALTEEVLKKGWYKTGDVGVCDQEGFYYIIDRTKDMIISGGENVYSIEVEQALMKHPSVQQAAVIGVPDEKWGEAVKALIVLNEGAVVTANELITHCRGLIGGYKIPKYYDFVEKLPTSPTGKVLKKMLRKDYSNP